MITFIIYPLLISTISFQDNEVRYYNSNKYNATIVSDSLRERLTLVSSLNGKYWNTIETKFNNNQPPIVWHEQGNVLSIKIETQPEIILELKGQWHGTVDNRYDIFIDTDEASFIKKVSEEVALLSKRKFAEFLIYNGTSVRVNYKSKTFENINLSIMNKFLCKDFTKYLSGHIFDFPSVASHELMFGNGELWFDGYGRVRVINVDCDISKNSWRNHEAQ
jgi:hypothetical protein